MDAFYNFWFSFKSWREFPHPDEEDIEQASAGHAALSAPPTCGCAHPDSRAAEQLLVVRVLHPLSKPWHWPRPHQARLPPGNLSPHKRHTHPAPAPDHARPPQAESREHRRWIERYNAKLRAAGKKEEFKRIREFVEAAERQDPR